MQLDAQSIERERVRAHVKLNCCSFRCSFFHLSLCVGLAPESRIKEQQRAEQSVTK